MSKNSQNKERYYEIGVLRGRDLIEEYVTALPIMVKGCLVHEEIMNYLKVIHGNDIIVLLNKKEGKIPNDNRGEIRVHVPEEPVLKYNR